MTRHTSNRHNKKNSVAKLLPALQETTSGYQVLSYWMTAMVGLLSVGLLLQRFRGAMPANAVSPSFTTATLPEDSGQPSYEIQCTGIAPLLLSSAVAYQTGNSVMGLLSSLPLWFARPVAAQTSGVTIVVPEFRVNSNVTSYQAYPAVASLISGEWVVVWAGRQTGNWDIYAQRYALSGSVLGSEFRVNSATTGSQLSPAMARLSTGEWLVVWQGEQTGDFDIYAQRYALSGSVLGSEFRVNSVTTGNQEYPKVASLSSGEWVVVWQGEQTSNLDIYAQRYAMNGSMLGSEFRVNSATTGDQSTPAVASLSAGEWMVAWEGIQTGNDYHIYAQRYAMNGNVLGYEFRVNSNVTGGQYRPAVASLSSGEWMVVWDGTQTGNWDIYAQRYAMNGSVLGSEFRVNSNVTRDQFLPAVTSVGGGDWVVVWYGSQTGNRDIYAQRYAMNGSMLGSEFRVNSATTGSQQNPVVASISAAKWVVVWESDQTGNDEIYGSIFSSTAPLSTTASSSLSSSLATSTLSTTVKSPVTTQVLSTSTLPVLTITTYNSSTSSASPTFPSVVTTQVTSTSLSTASTDNSKKMPAITTALNIFKSPSSAGMTETITTAQTPTSPTTLPLVMATNANSGVSGVVIGAAVGAGGFAVAACLGALGFYAYRKKSRAGQANHSAVSEVGASLKTIEQTPAQPASEYAQVSLKDLDQSDNMIPISNSPYGRLDEMKQQEKEYDHAPSF